MACAVLVSNQFRKDLGHDIKQWQLPISAPSKFVNAFLKRGRTRDMSRFQTIIFAALLIALYACGGGDPEDLKTIDKPDCANGSCV